MTGRTLPAGRRRVLAAVHDFSVFSGEEATFWETVREELRARDHELILMGAGDPPVRMDVPRTRIRYRMDFHGAPLDDVGGDWVPEVVDREAVLARETQWAGPARGPRELEARVTRYRFLEGYFATALSLLDPVLVLIWNPFQSHNMVLEQLAADRGCPVLYLERGPMPGTLHVDDRGTTAASSIAVRSDWSWDAQEEAGRWRDVYHGLAHRYRERAATWWDQPERVGADRVRERLGIPDDARVVLFAGQVDDDTSNFLFAPDHADNAEAFADFCQLVAPHPDVYVLGKHHPRSTTSPRVYRRAIDGPGTWATDLALADCLRIADRVAAVNSTVLFEALLLEKPVLSMGRSILSGKDIAYELLDAPDRPATVAAWLAAEGWPQRHARWQDLGAFLLAHHLYPFSDRVVDGGRTPADLADRLVGAAEARSSRPLRFDGLAWLEIGPRLVAEREEARNSIAWRLGRRFPALRRPTAWLVKRLAGLLRRLRS